MQARVAGMRLDVPKKLKPLFMIEEPKRTSSLVFVIKTIKTKKNQNKTNPTNEIAQKAQKGSNRCFFI